MDLRVRLLNPYAKVPTRAYRADAGLDLYAYGHATLPPGKITVISTGLAIEFDEGYVALICDRSSMGAKGIKVMGGVVDASYRGEVKVCLANLSGQTVSVLPGDKIAQLLVLPIATPEPMVVTELNPSERGEGGFGSSG